MFNNIEDKFLQKCLQIQQEDEKYPGKWSKLFKFLKLIVQNKAFEYSKFEKLVLKEPSDCSIVSKYSKFETFKITSQISGLSVKSITLNTLRIPHSLSAYVEKIDKINLEKNSENLKFEDMESKVSFLKDLETNLKDLPVVVVIHGLGGQMSQFEDLFLLLSQSCEVFAVDLPGFGQSRFDKNPGVTLSKNNMITDNEMEWQDYNTDRIVEILQNVILNDESLKHRNFILIGHSMGTHLCLKLCLKLNQMHKDKKVESMILLAPPDIIQSSNSYSGGLKTKMLLFLFMYFPSLFNLMRSYDRLGGFNSNSINRMVNNDASYYIKLRQIRWNLDSDSHAWLRYVSEFSRVTQEQFIACISKFKTEEKPKVLFLCGDNDPIVKAYDRLCGFCDELKIPFEHRKIPDCGHSILLEKPELTCGVIMKFLINNVDERLDPSFVLILKAILNGDKWGLKNYEKWKSVQNVSKQIINPSTKEVAPIFAMKTLRNNDGEHSPEILETKRPDIAAIIDISATGTSDSYDPKLFKRIRYYKLATISKIPPDSALVRKFNKLVNTALKDMSERGQEGAKVAVHCHYGFNRTGYLVCCYLVDCLHWDVSDAIAAFKDARDPGIKHQHFIDELFLKYQ